MTTDISWSFQCGLRGYHEYKVIWTPALNEILPAIHESGNSFDCYAIAARKCLPGTLAVESTVGHLPKELSRFTRFVMLHGATVVAEVLDTHHRRSPLVQGGLEIPIQVTVRMDYSPQNKDALFKYESLVEQYYKEPVDGKFEDFTDTVLRDLEDADDEKDDEVGDMEEAVEALHDRAEDTEEAMEEAASTI